VSSLLRAAWSEVGPLHEPVSHEQTRALRIDSGDDRRAALRVDKIQWSPISRNAVKGFQFGSPPRDFRHYRDANTSD
jgi:hypothetical protein